MLHRRNAYRDLIKPNEKAIFQNKRVSPGYTYTSRLIKNNFGFNPKTTIPRSLLDNLDYALEEARYLTKSLEEMAKKIGENISDFIRKLLEDPRT
jgi:hypothetical protein